MASQPRFDEDSSSDLLPATGGSSRTVPRAKRCRVLVIEDDTSDYQMVVRHLRRAEGIEFQTERAIRLADGLDRLSSGLFDVVLLDLNLPDSWGLETLQRLRQHGRREPIIVLTGHPDESQALRAVRQGAQDYLVKGEFGRELLVRSVRYAIARNRSKAKLARALQSAHVSSESLRNVITHNVDAMLVVDRTGTILFCNPAAGAMYGRAAGELVGRSCQLPLESRHVAEVAIPHAAGHRVPAELRVGEVTWEGAPAYLAVLHDLTLQKQTQSVLEQSEARYRSLFEDSPVAMREEDFSGVKAFVDQLRRAGIENPRVYFAQHPEAVVRCARRIRITEVNSATLDLYQARSKKEFYERFALRFQLGNLRPFQEELVAIAEGKTRFECETVIHTFAGEQRDVALRWSVAPGYEDTLARVWVSMVDLTDFRRARDELDQNAIQLNVAKAIQQRLLPQAPPELAGYDVAGVLYPAHFAAGDYFDYLPMRDGATAFAIGDVSGHGFGPAVLMATASAHLRSLVQVCDDPSQTLKLLNRLLYVNTDAEFYVTLLLAKLIPHTGSLVFTSAGHRSGYILDAGGTLKTRLDSTSFPLAIMADAEFPVGTPSQLAPGDTAVLLTDGVIEARSPAGAYFAENRVLDVVRCSRGDTAQATLELLCQSVRAFCGRETLDDDLTAIVIKRL